MEQHSVINELSRITMYTVITWDEQHKCTRYHAVVDAIDYDDAQHVVEGLHPEQKVMGITYTGDYDYTPRQ